MPALEIMPQCATMEEAQRRANIQRGLPYSSKSNHPQVTTSSPRSATLENDDHDRHSTTSPTSPKSSPSGRLARFVKRNLPGIRRRSYPPYHDDSDLNYQDKDKTQPTSTSTSTSEIKVSIVKVTTPDHRGQTKGNNTTNEGFSPIGVKYWPKIIEDEEEEPPEALQFNSCH